jgi:hypothetical protein
MYSNRCCYICLIMIDWSLDFLTLFCTYIVFYEKVEKIICILYMVMIRETTRIFSLNIPRLFTLLISKLFMGVFSCIVISFASFMLGHMTIRIVDFSVDKKLLSYSLYVEKFIFYADMWLIRIVLISCWKFNLLCR